MSNERYDIYLLSYLSYFEFYKHRKNTSRFALKKESVKKMLVNANHLQLFFKTNSNELVKMNKSINNFLNTKKNRNINKRKNNFKKLNTNSSAGFNSVKEKLKKTLPLHKFKTSKDAKANDTKDSSNSSDCMPILRNKDLMSLKKSNKPTTSYKDVSLNSDDVFINERTGQKFSFFNGSMKLIDDSKNIQKGINIVYDPPEKIYLDIGSKVKSSTKKKKSKIDRKSYCKCKHKETFEDFLSHSHSFDTNNDDDNDVTKRSRATNTKKFELVITGRSVDEFNKTKKKSTKNSKKKNHSAFKTKERDISTPNVNDREENLPKSLSIYDLLPSRAVIGLPLLTSTKLTDSSEKANVNDNCKKYEINANN